MTTSGTVQRKLTTILAADAAGYSSAMDADEIGTLEALRASREVFYKFIERHNGRVANTAGDGLIADFPSVVEAVQCAIEVQRELGDAGHAAKGPLRFRIGIHLGDVLVDGDDLLGEGVNLAARLETMAEPGGVLISQQVYDQVRHKLSVGFEYLGEKRPKNFSQDVPVYCVSFTDDAPKPFFGRRGAAQRHRQTPQETARPPRGHADIPVGRDTADMDALREKVGRSAKTLGVIWLGLLAINLMTGGSFWAQWPGVVMIAVLGMQAAPLVANERFGVGMVRFAVVVAMLALINLFSWSGTAWVFWPALALGITWLIRRARLSG